ncbi:metalloregulator ArsR/SmtB family transcription factor [Peptoniphilus sp. KCTC 25270]|uniref:ArsR/SmtB family transcription factor n=1 Tax=Peptoniphilus sp. KCTC 25270 TaxID=2897414 RepID=UPI001E623502|nr:metalloregulator ArsR/SmtB family transcription factor [Peptoniphilus sp. KCTC 25270]MCD1147513.1 metalloregulator ArsR/SmtB family transcription factor [Peptoniphilus sp. KCTC 25270]
MNRIDISLICKALSDSNRLQILEILGQEERCACHILEKLEITQPTLSHHMKILNDCNLVKTRKEGKWSHYSIEKETLKELENFIGKFSRG